MGGLTKVITLLEIDKVTAINFFKSPYRVERKNCLERKSNFFKTPYQFFILHGSFMITYALYFIYKPFKNPYTFFLNFILSILFKNPYTQKLLLQIIHDFI